MQTCHSGTVGLDLLYISFFFTNVIKEITSKQLLKVKCLCSLMWPYVMSPVGLRGHSTVTVCVRLSGAKEWMILNPRGIHFDSERWGIWVSTSKTTYSRCGVRLKCCGEPQGLIEHIEPRFSGLSRCSEDSQAGISGPLLASWLLILLTKSVRLLFTGIFLPLKVFVYPCTMAVWALTYMGTFYAAADFNSVICQQGRHVG